MYLGLIAYIKTFLFVILWPEVFFRDRAELNEIRFEDEESEKVATKLRMIQTSKQKVFGLCELNLPNIG